MLILEINILILNPNKCGDVCRYIDDNTPDSTGVCCEGTQYGNACEAGLNCASKCVAVPCIGTF